MAQWSCQKGSTLLIPSGPKDGHKHLFAVLLTPTEVDGYGKEPMALMVCVTSFKEGVANDDTCVLNNGDHPFIEHSSFIDYRFTRLEKAKFVETKVQSGEFIEKEPCSPDLIKRIIQGALKSRKINREHKKILEEILFK
jgi:hypothetical protein